MSREIDLAINDVAGAFDALRQHIWKADTMVYALERLVEGFPWGGEDDGGKSRRLQHLAHLLGGVKEAVGAAVRAVEPIAMELAKRRDGHMSNRAPTGHVTSAAADRAPTGHVIPAAAARAPIGHVTLATKDFLDDLDALRSVVGAATRTAFDITNRGDAQPMHDLLRTLANAATTAVAVVEQCYDFLAAQSRAENR